MTLIRHPEKCDPNRVREVQSLSYPARILTALEYRYGGLRRPNADPGPFKPRNEIDILRDLRRDFLAMQYKWERFIR
jgi:hypothetical protein